MIGKCSPESAGSSARDISEFVERLRRRGITMHSTLMLRGSDIFFESYCPPFGPTDVHRMYSVTKSFVSAAVGCLVSDGRVSLDDPILKYFPEQVRDDTHKWLRDQTVRDMLMMRTCFAGGPGWFQTGLKNRVDYYFARTPVRPAGTIFDYDSTGSYILGVMVERVSGMPLLQFLKERLLDEIGGFEDAQILHTMDGTPWGDSGLLCTPRALMSFAYMIMHGGDWFGRQLLDADYVKAATSRQTDNDPTCSVDYTHRGYGYQFWMTERNGFAFLGMGGQLAICLPDKDFIFVCTGDNQLSEATSMYEICTALFECVTDRLDGGAERITAAEEIPAYELPVVKGERDSALSAVVSGRWYALEPNTMGIDRIRVTLDGGEGLLEYTNAQGYKALRFGVDNNVVNKFPELGYSDEYGNRHIDTGFMYDCATSGAWVDENQLRIRVQIIDRYFGGLAITLGWRNADEIGVRMYKVAEDFLQTYEGWAGGRAE